MVKYKIKDINYLKQVANTVSDLIDEHSSLTDIQYNFIENLKPNIVPQTHNKFFLNMFPLIKTYDTDHYDYYIITCQSRNIKRQLKNIKDKFPNGVNL